MNNVFKKLFLKIENILFIFYQNICFPKNLRKSEKVIVVIVPQKPAINGGTFSLFSISKKLREERGNHGYDVLVVTEPQKKILNKTYIRNKFFKNDEFIFRFSQIKNCNNANNIIINIPEYLSSKFAGKISRSEKIFLKNIKNLRINILNQNIDLMPAPNSIDSIKKLAATASQSVAHHAYGTQAMADKYGLPTLILPAYTDLSHYTPSDFSKKEKIIIYSPDRAGYKKQCLDNIRAYFTDFDLIEINGISFDTFMNLATRCMFSITFGEGFDGYFSQPMQMGGLSFAVFNERFFPPLDISGRENLFSGPDEMVREIAGRMKVLAADEERYRALNKLWVSDINAMYDPEDYRRRILMLARGEYDFYPKDVRMT